MPARLSPSDRKRLEELIQYLNLEEMKVFCQAHDLPIYIHVECAEGKPRRAAPATGTARTWSCAALLDFAVHGKRAGPTFYANGVVPDGRARFWRIPPGRYAGAAVRSRLRHV